MDHRSGSVTPWSRPGSEPPPDLFRFPEIDWATEPGVDPVFRAAILWWHQRIGGSGFDDVYTIEEFLAHVRPLIEAETLRRRRALP